MAITKNDAIVLFSSLGLGVSFKKMLTLGRMELFMSSDEIRELALKYQQKSIPEVDVSGGYAEPLYQILGAEKADSMDFSAYEKASIIHDLNQPIEDELKQSYSLVMDGGTIEHVFNFPQAIKNCMQMIETGGHYIGITPVNNLMGHGFYQYSPELYYRIFSEENGFRVKKMYVNVRTETISEWYEVADPLQVKTRVVLQNNLPAHVVVIAEKTAEKNIFEKMPQQSDYSYTWNVHEALSGNQAALKESGGMLLYRKFFPRRLKIILHNLYDILFKEKAQDHYIGNFNPAHYKKINL
ncbi:MAG: hypothetical protein WAT19_08595 [Ferruginibacter sp.]